MHFLQQMQLAEDRVKVRSRFTLRVITWFSTIGKSRENALHMLLSICLIVTQKNPSDGCQSLLLCYIVKALQLVFEVGLSQKSPPTILC